MYLPQEGDTFDNIDTYTVKSRQAPYAAYELTSPDVQEAYDYEPILDTAADIADETDELFLSVEWVQKKDCIVVISGAIDQLIKRLEESGYKMSYTTIYEKPYLSTGKTFRDRAIFEVIIERMASCASDDKLYLCYDWKKGMNSIIWVTDKPVERLECVGPKGVFFEPE